MTIDIARVRMHNQRLATAGFATPEQVVRWLCAVQAQEYPASKWALGMRMRSATDAAIERAFTAGKILRTHILRPTWHFVAPADIRWMLALSAPRVRRCLSSYDRTLGIDAAVIRRSHAAITRALRDGAQLTRQELKVVLQRAGVNTDGVQKLSHVLMHAELDAVVCSGGRRGSQFTYALLEDRVPAGRVLPREEALAELTRRYVVSHGPAQVRDFGWWSGLTMKEAREGLALAGAALASDVIDGRTYWFASSLRTIAKPPRTAHFLGLYDEYLIAYKDRSAALDAERWARAARRHRFVMPLVIGGQVAGAWRQIIGSKGVAITLTTFEPLNRQDKDAVDEAAAAYGRFLDADVTVTTVPLRR
jgi:hypothetical protein